jgi:hypothetical protein
VDFINASLFYFAWISMDFLFSTNYQERCFTKRTSTINIENHLKETIQHSTSAIVVKRLLHWNILLIFSLLDGGQPPFEYLFNEWGFDYEGNI